MTRVLQDWIIRLSNQDFHSDLLDWILVDNPYSLSDFFIWVLNPLFLLKSKCEKSKPFYY